MEIPCTAPRVLIIGIGNDYRSDDSVGLVVARRLRRLVDNGVTILEESGEGTSLVERWRCGESVIVIDAVSSESRPGRVLRFDASTESIPARHDRQSTHGFGLAEAIDLARSLNSMPARLIVYGIVGKNFGAGTALSREVEEAVKQVVERVKQEIQAAV